MRDAIVLMQKPFTKPGVRLYLLLGVYNSLVRSRVWSVSLVCLCLSLASCSTNGVLMECCETKKCKWDIWKYDSIGEALYSQSPLYGHLVSLSLSLGKESPYIFSQFNPLNTDTFNGPSVSVLTGFDRIRFRLTAHLTTLPSPNRTLTLSFHLRQSSTDNILCEYKFVTAVMGKGKRKKE